MRFYIDVARCTVIGFLMGSAVAPYGLPLWAHMVVCGLAVVPFITRQEGD